MNVFCRRKQLLLLLLIVGYHNIMAQKSNHYTLPALIDSAAKYYPQLLQKQALANSAKANLKDVKHSFLPSLNISDELNIGSANQLPGTSLPMEIIPSVSGANRSANNWQAATGNIGVLYSEYLLADFGLKSAKINNAESFINVQTADVQRTLFSVKANIVQLYIQLVQAQQRINAEKLNIERYQDIFRMIKSITASGLVAGVDSSLAKAELSKARSGYNQMTGIIYQLKDQLSFYTGIPTATLKADTTAVIDLSATISEQYLPDTINHPLIEYFMRKRELSLANERLVSKSFQPKILLAGSSWARGSSITYNDQYKSLDNGFGYQRFNYAAGLSFVYDLFNRMHRKDKLEVVHYQTEAANYDLAQEKLSLSNAQQQSQDAIKVAEDDLKELPIQMNAAQDVYIQKKAQYKAGMISLIDLTNASFVLYRSQIDYINAMSNWHLAVFNKATASNNLDQFINQLK